MQPDHIRYVTRYLAGGPSRRVVLLGYSQGGCLAMMEVLEMAPADLDRTALVLVAPAREVLSWRRLALSRRIVARCGEAERAIIERMQDRPQGSLARLIRERTLVAWSGDDKVVGKDTLVLAKHLAPGSVTVVPGFSHAAWARQRKGRAPLEKLINEAMGRLLGPVETVSRTAGASGAHGQAAGPAPAAARNTARRLGAV